MYVFCIMLASVGHCTVWHLGGCHALLL